MNDKYLIFGGLTYYPSGGIKDFFCSTQTRKQALEFVLGQIKKRNTNCDWWQIAHLDKRAMFEEYITFLGEEEEAINNLLIEIKKETENEKSF